MVHSVELLLDHESETAVRRIWATLSDMGLRSPAPTSRPHVTLVVADRIGVQADTLLGSLCDRFPFPYTVGAPLVFGGGPFILVRSVLPSVELLAIQSEAYRICSPHASPTLIAHSAPGNWSPHVTLARRVAASQLSGALKIRHVVRDLGGSAVGLRHWDGNNRVEHRVC